MTPSIEERELAIESLLELAESHEVNWPSLLITLGATDRENAIERICELTDPSAWKLAVADNEQMCIRDRDVCAPLLAQQGLRTGWGKRLGRRYRPRQRAEEIHQMCIRHSPRCTRPCTSRR